MKADENLKSILLSVKPKWLEKTLNGEKKIEFRKTKPNCELPIDVFLYCTKDKPFLGYEVSEFLSHWVLVDDKDNLDFGCVNGKVIAKFTLVKTEDMRKYEWSWKDNHYYGILKEACVTEQDLQEYMPLKMPLSAWHISDLVIFDEPKELKDFIKDFDDMDTDAYGREVGWYKQPIPLTKAPQSWQYVWEKER